MVENQHTTKCWARLSMNCCTFFWRSSFCTCVSINNSIGFGSHPRIVACKIKMFSVKYIYKKTTFKMDVIKKNLTMCFAIKTNGMEPLVCVVTKLWICRLRFPKPDCDHHVKREDSMCWMYFSLQFTRCMASLNPSKLPHHFSLVYRLLSYNFWISFVPRTKNHAIYMVQMNYL